MADTDKLIAALEGMSQSLRQLYYLMNRFVSLMDTWLSKIDSSHTPGKVVTGDEKKDDKTVGKKLDEPMGTPVRMDIFEKMIHRWMGSPKEVDDTGMNTISGGGKIVRGLAQGTSLEGLATMLAPETGGLSLLIPAIDKATQVFNFADIFGKVLETTGYVVSAFGDTVRGVSKNFSGLIDVFAPVGAGVGKMAQGLGGFMPDLSLSGMFKMITEGPSISNLIKSTTDLAQGAAQAAIALVKMPLAIKDFTGSVIEGMRKFEDVSGAMTVVLAQRDVKNLVRDMNEGQRLSGATKWADNQNQRLADQTKYLERIWNAIEQYGAGLLARVVAAGLEANPLMRILRYIADQIGDDEKKMGMLFGDWVEGVATHRARDHRKAEDKAEGWWHRKGREFGEDQRPGWQKAMDPQGLMWPRMPPK